MKNRIRLITLILLVLIVNISLKADNGLWKIHNVFNENRTRVLDTKDKVYFVTDYSLNAYNKKNDTFEQLSVLNKLSSFYVNNIYYNAQKDYVVVTYKDYNIDILLANGITKNIAEIKNLTTIGARDINDVTFGDNGFYVASKIGYIFVEDKNFTVKKSAFFNEEVKSVAEIGEKVFIAAKNNVYYASNNIEIKSLSNTTASTLNVTGTILPIDEKSFFLNSNLLYYVSVGDNGVMTKTAVSSAKVVDVQPMKEGFIAVGGTSFTVTNKLYIFDTSGNKTADISLPAELSNTLLSSYEKDGSIWRLNNVGLTKISLDTKNLSVKNITEVLVPKLNKVSRAIAMSYNKNNNRLYVTNGNPRNNNTVQKYGVNGQISSYDGKSWKNEVPADLQGYKFQDPSQLEFDPNEENTYYAGTWYQGVYKIKDNKILAKYDWTNSTLLHALSNWFCHTPCVQFDADGNLWIIQSTEGYINILPKDKLSKTTTELTASDWKYINLGRNFSKSVEFFVTKNGYKILFDGDMDGKIHIFNNDDDFNVNHHKVYEYFYDKDNKKIEWSYVLDIKEDLNGFIWFTTNCGIFCINQEDISNDKIYAISPKNAKNYDILDNIFSMSIDIDDYNRKWVGTLDDGLYLLNADCTKVLKHFNSSNACLPNNTVQAVCWNSNTQSVFVGLNGGLLEYIPDNGNNIDNVYMIPNHITPDYKGKIMFDKVPVNSTLYIKDSEDKIVKTIQCKKSKIYWNGITDENKSLETGIYTVSVKLHNSDTVEDKLMSFTVIK